MFNRRVPSLCAALTLCICLAIGQSWANDLTAAPSDVSDNQIRLKNGELRKDRSYTSQARPNASYNVRPVYPVLLPQMDENAAQPRGVAPDCTLPPCDIIIYDNLAGPASAGAFGDNDGVPLYDDCALVGLDRFICRFTLGLGGLNNTGGIAPVTLEIRSGNYFPICPEDPRSEVLYTATQNIALTNPFNLVSYNVDPPVFLDYDFFWVGVSTPPPDNDAGWTIGGQAEVGYTENNIVIPNMNGTCEDLGPGQMDDYFWYGGDPWAGMGVQILANPGPPGACCVRDIDLGGGLAQCDDEVFRSQCLSASTTNLWRPGECAEFGEDPPCAPCISLAGACDGATVASEANCSNGYIDTHNPDCTVPSLPIIGCGDRICGTSGTYASACTTDTQCAGGISCVGGVCDGPPDTRDNDWYRLVLTETRQVSIKVRARFAVQLSLMNNGGDPLTCSDEALDFEAGRACEELVINRCLPAGTWHVRVRPDTFSAIPCDTRYRLEVDCGSCTLPTGACCDASMAGCSILAEVACVGRDGVYRGNDTTCETADCPGVPANNLCSAATLLPTSAVRISFRLDTTFASDTTTPPADPGNCTNELDNGTTPIRKDVFFRYRIPTNYLGTAITIGDVVISTNDQPDHPHESLFDTWVVVYGNPSMANPCDAATLCGRPQYECNDNILNNGTNFKFNSLSHLVIPVQSGSGSLFDPGDCILIRVGRGVSGITPANPPGGPGWLNIDFIPRSAPFSLDTGRCCFDADDAFKCTIELTEAACIGAGGFPRSRLDYNQGDPSVVEQVAGCDADPCPRAGDACYTALDLNDMLGGDAGTITRGIRNVTYFRYTVPDVGGIVLHTCGSAGFYDPILGVYPNSINANGDCNLSALIKFGDDCTSTTSAADGALTSAPCYGGINATSSACLCLSVGPGMDVQAGQEIIIAFGSSNQPGKQFVFQGSPRLIVNPVTDPLDPPVLASLSVVTLSQCFSCPSDCPGGALQEGSDFICVDTADPQPQDLHNGGCSATPPSFNGPTIDCSGGPVVICGRAGNYRHPFPCDNTFDCPNLEPCSGQGGFCIGPARFVARDEDWYRIVVDSPRTIRWRSLSSEFALQMEIFADPEGDCDNIFVLAAGSTDFACTPPTGEPSNLEVSASVCAGTYYLRVTPSVFGGLGDTSCNAEYTVEASCEEFVQPVSCCLGDMNGDGKVNGLDIQKWISVLFTPPTALDNFLGCFAANFCRADINSSGAIDLADLPDFVDLLVTANKPVCTLGPVCSDAATSQLPFDSQGITKSDLDATDERRAADCFKPLESGMISTVCWWGAYADIAGVDCGPEFDCFQITFYSMRDGCEKTQLNRCPDLRIEPPGSIFVPDATRVATGAIITPNGLVTEWFYTATLPTPIQVTAGQCMWMEIVNKTPASNCQWHWEQSPQGDTRHAAIQYVVPTGDLPTNYDDCTAAARDLAFSINLRIDKGGCARPIGRCCYDAPPLGTLNCDSTTEDYCRAVLNGEWIEDGNCSDPHPPGLPADPPCVVGRCCYLDEELTPQCVSTLLSACNAVGGLWVEAASCPCPTGRCCLGPGNCQDSYTEIQCISAGGIWGLGETCASPCPTGICNNVGRCQLPHLSSGLQQGGYVSDADNEVSTADDFRPTFTSGLNYIDQICFRGFHRRTTVAADCGGGVETSETFRITYYASAGDLPDTSTIIGGPFNVTPLKSVPVPTEGVQGFGAQYQYEAFHAAVPVTANQCYWIEIVQTVSDSDCVFLWATSNEGGNQKAAIRKYGAAGDAFPYQVVDRDLSFCVGPVNVGSASCAFSPVAPPNNTCANAINLGTGSMSSPVVGTTIGATLEPNASAGCTNAATAADVYYKWTAASGTGNRVFSLCYLDTTFDSVLSVHLTTGTNVPPGGCPPTTVTQVNPLSGCNADGCPAGFGTNFLFFQGRQSRVSVGQAVIPAGSTVVVRVSGTTKGGPGNNPPNGKFRLLVTQ